MRIASLDGLRAVSILLVILSHGFLATAVDYPRLARFGQLIANWGASGVAIFFGISGFIITHLLIREYREHGRIDLRAFYVRRAMRILPPLWAYLLYIVMFASATTRDDVVRAFAFVTDYVQASWPLAHTWSLSVEEKFYLIWPFLVSRVRTSTAIGVALALLLLSPLLRALTLVAQHGSAMGLQGRFHLIVDAIMIGCLIALLTNYAPGSRLLRVLRSSWLVGPSVVFLLLHSAVVPRASAVAGINLLPVGLSIRAIAVGSMLAWTLSHEGSRFVALLSSRAMTHIGVMSYSLYLWQQPFCDSTLRLPIPVLWPLRLGGCFLAAELSHLLVERPALALRKRWLDPRSTAAADPST